MGNCNSKRIKDEGDPPPYDDWNNQPVYASSNNDSLSTPALITPTEVNNAVFSIRAELLIKNNPGDSEKWSEPRICIIKFIKNINGTCSLKALDINTSEVLLNHFIAPEYQVSTVTSDYFKLHESSNLDNNWGRYRTYTVTRDSDLKGLSNLLALKIGLIFGSIMNGENFRKEFKNQQKVNKRIEGRNNFKEY